MSGEYPARLGRFPKDDSAQRTPCSAPLEADRCVVCGDLVDPFTRCANLEPSNVCLDCRMAPAESVPARKAA